MVKLFVGNLARVEGSAVVTNRDLKPLFEKYGDVTECVVFENKGFGFVHMGSQKAAERAVRELKGCHVVGQRISVELSTDNRGTNAGSSAKSATKPVTDTTTTRTTSASSSTGAISKTRTNIRREDDDQVLPLMPDFECLDCGVATTSCFLLEGHLNTEMHWERVKQIKLEEKNMKGVVGNISDTWCDGCGARVNKGEMEKHEQEELHMDMIHGCFDQRDWIKVQDAKTKFREKAVPSEDIHLCNIPLAMTKSRFTQICSQFGQVIKLRLMLAGGEESKHAYVRFKTQQSQDLATEKLKKMQTFHFVKQLLEISDESDEAGVGVTKINIFTQGKLRKCFVCDLCEVACNSLKQLGSHMKGHRRREMEEHYRCLNSATVLEDSFENLRREPHSGNVDDSSADSIKLFPVSPSDTENSGQLKLTKLVQLKLSQLGNQLEIHKLSQMSNQMERLEVAKQKHEGLLIICQKQLNKCKEEGLLAQSLELLEMELEIHRKLKDIENEAQTVKYQLDAGLEQNCTAVDSCESELIRQDCSDNHLIRKVNTLSSPIPSPPFPAGSEAVSQQLAIREYFLPDDVFISDDDDLDQEDLFIHETNFDTQRKETRLAEARRFLGSNT